MGLLSKGVLLPPSLCFCSELSAIPACVGNNPGKVEWASMEVTQLDYSTSEQIITTDPLTVLVSRTAAKKSK